MSVSTEIPDASAAPGSGNGVTDPKGQPSIPRTVPTSAGSEGIAPGETGETQSLEERVRTFQSKADAAEARYNKLAKRLGSLTPDWIEKLGGGDAVFGMLKHYATHPNFNQFVQEYNSDGTIRSPLIEATKTTDDDDEYLDPAVKELREQFASANRQIADLSRQLAANTAATGSEKFTQHVQKWIGRYEDLTDEEIERVRERGTITVNRLGANITQLSEADVATLLRGTFSDDEWDSFMERRALRRLQNQQQRGTDSPSSLSIRENVPENLNKLDPRQVWAEAVRRIT
jgi:hypothetical protein